MAEFWVIQLCKITLGRKRGRRRVERWDSEEQIEKLAINKPAGQQNITANHFNMKQSARDSSYLHICSVKHNPEIDTCGWWEWKNRLIYTNTPCSVWRAHYAVQSESIRSWWSSTSGGCVIQQKIDRTYSTQEIIWSSYTDSRLEVGFMRITNAVFFLLNGNQCG